MDVAKIDVVLGGELALGVRGPKLKKSADRQSVRVENDSGDLAGVVAGSVQADSLSLTQGVVSDELKAMNEAGTAGVALRAPATLPGEVSLTLPGGVGVAGQVLSTDGSGALSFVDMAVPETEWIEPAAAATTAQLVASYDGPAMTLTADANGALAVDGVSVTLGARVLVKDQSQAAENGVYVVTDAGSASTAFVLTRAPDMDSEAEFAKRAVFVEGGTQNGEASFLTAVSGSVVVGTTEIQFARFAGVDVDFSQIDAGSVTQASATIEVDADRDDRLPTTKAVAEHVERFTRLHRFVLDFAERNLEGDEEAEMVSALLMSEQAEVVRLVVRVRERLEQPVVVEVGVTDDGSALSAPGSADSTRFLGQTVFQEVGMYEFPVLEVFADAVSERAIQVRVACGSDQSCTVGSMKIAVLVAPGGGETISLA